MAQDLRPSISTAKSGIKYERLGKAVEDALILDYLYILQNPRRQILSTFMRGIFAGIGTVIGATLGVAVLVAVLQIFGGFPVIGEYFQNIGKTIERR